MTEIAAHDGPEQLPTTTEIRRRNVAGAEAPTSDSLNKREVTEALSEEGQDHGWNVFRKLEQ